MEMILEHRPDGAVIVQPIGRLDLLSATAFKQKLGEIVDLGKARIIVDLADVAFIDSLGLGALVAGLKLARSGGGDLRIARPGDQAKLILELTTLNRVMRPYATVDEALAGF